MFDKQTSSISFGVCKGWNSLGYYSYYSVMLYHSSGCLRSCIFDFPTFIQMPLTPTSVLVFGLQEACRRQDLKWNQASFSFPPGLFSNCRVRSKCSLRLRLNSPLQFLVVAGKVPSCTHENRREVRRMGNRHRRTPAKDYGASLLHLACFQSYEG